MALTKKRKQAEAKVDKTKDYSLQAASSLVKEINITKFDASVDLHVRLGVDPKKADQQVQADEQVVQHKRLIIPTFAHGCQRA